MSRQPVEANIRDLSHDGRGVAKVDDKTVFIHRALPGERVEFIYSSRRKQFDQGDVAKIISASPHRIEPRCPHFDVCAGCSLQHLSYEQQLAAKHKVLAESLTRIGKVAGDEMFEPVSAIPWNYRRKARLSVRNVPGKGRVLVGFRERNGRYVADMRVCHVLRAELGDRLEELSALIGRLDARDDIPQIEYAGGDDRSLLVFRHLVALSAADRQALLSFQSSSGMEVALQDGGPETIVDLAGNVPADLHYRADEDRISYAFRPTDFVQINAAVNELVIAKTVELLALDPSSRVLDLFCGLGNLTLPLARRTASVIGIEGEASLVERAVCNARDNDIHNAEFFAADLREDHASASWATRGYDAVVIDPPRSGAAEVLPLIAELAPAKLVYISCHPGTLARDLGQLVNCYGYQLRTAGIFDMFPHTAHVESMALLERDG